MQTEILNIEMLSIGYGKHKRVNKICEQLSSSIKSGELVCLLGENGSGKSTLIRTLCGFQPALSGNAFLLGKDVFSLKEKDLALLVSVVLTDRVIVPNATVEELVGLGRSPYTGVLGSLNNDDKFIIEESIKKCGIYHKKKSMLSDLSDGERQKAFIAKALAQDTPVIVLDEPTAFLDLPARIEIMQLLREIVSSSQKSVLMSTHDLDLANQMADTLWLLSPGGPLITGSPEDLLLNNAFQSMFKNRNIIFDNKTGLFKAKYQYHSELSVKGHGFEYVLLRRAFTRKGVQIKKMSKIENIWIDIDTNNNMFHLYNGNKIIASENKVESIVKIAMLSLN